MKTYTQILRAALLGSLLILATGLVHAITLGDQDVPPEKFHIFIVMGDSNTFGASHEWESEHLADWTNDRTWALNGEGQWVPATIDIPQARPLVGGEERHDDGRAGTGYWVVRHLAEAFPDHHFGVVEHCYAGMMGEGADVGSALGSYDSYVDLLLPYKGQFHLIGYVLDGVADRRGDSVEKLATLREYWKEDFGIETVPIIQCGWRLRNYHIGGEDARDVRATEEVIPHLADEGRNLGREYVITSSDFYKATEDVALIYGFNYRMRDNRHNAITSEFGEWGHDIADKRYVSAMIANGWAIPGLPKDETPPSVPTGVKVTRFFDKGVSLAWEPSQDNVAVRGYNVYLNGEKVAWWHTLPNDLAMVTTALPRASIGHLEPEMTCEFRVSAVDFADNESELSAPLRGKTPAGPKAPEFPLKINIGGDATGDWVADKEFHDGGGYGTMLSPGGIWAEREAAGKLEDQLADGPEKEVLKSYRRAPNAYKFFVPNGKYHLTWLLKVRPWNVTELDRREYQGGKLPDSFDLVTWPEESPFAEPLNPETGYLDGRAIRTTIEITDNQPIQFPGQADTFGDSGTMCYGLILEPAN